MKRSLFVLVAISIVSAHFGRSQSRSSWIYSTHVGVGLNRDCGVNRTSARTGKRAQALSNRIGTPQGAQPAAVECRVHERQQATKFPEVQFRLTQACMAWLALPVTVVLIAISWAAWPQKYLVAAQQSDLQSSASSSLLTQVFTSQSDLVSQALCAALAYITLCCMLHAA